MPLSFALAAMLILAMLQGRAMAQDLGDAEAGAEVFGMCVGCHQVGAGAEHGIGPHLNGIFGRKAGAMPGFDYSAAMTRAGATGLEWHADTLHLYIENPAILVSGTRMSFGGIDDVTERADLLAFLRQYSDNPRDLPGADPTRTATLPGLAPEVLALQGDREYGAYLAGECVSCHQADGSAQGIPSILYWPERDFVLALHAYKLRHRPNPVMQMIAGRLTDEEIAALAAYFRNPD